MDSESERIQKNISTVDVEATTIGETEPQDEVQLHPIPNSAFEQYEELGKTEPQNQVPLEAVIPEVQSHERVSVEEFKISGDALVGKVKQLLHQGNIRRIIVKNEEGRILVEIPLTVGVIGGVIGAAMFPVVAALGAIGAMVAHLTLVVEKKE
jgi:hypothetical protein